MPKSKTRFRTTIVQCARHAAPEPPALSPTRCSVVAALLRSQPQAACQRSDRPASLIMTVFRFVRAGELGCCRCGLYRGGCTLVCTTATSERTSAAPGPCLLIGCGETLACGDKGDPLVCSKELDHRRARAELRPRSNSRGTSRTTMHSGRGAAQGSGETFENWRSRRSTSMEPTPNATFTTDQNLTATR
jgi:hypothetical protein